MPEKAIAKNNETDYVYSKYPFIKQLPLCQVYSIYFQNLKAKNEPFVKDLEKLLKNVVNI